MENGSGVETQAPMPPTRTKAEKRRQARQRKKMQQQIIQGATVNQAAIEEEEKRAKLKQRIAQLRNRRQPRQPYDINPQTGEKMNKKYQQQLAKHISGEGVDQILADFGVRDERISNEVRRKIAKGEVRDSQQLVQTLAQVVQERGGIKTIPDTPAAQIQQAMQDPNCKGVKFGAGPPPKEEEEK